MISVRYLHQCMFRLLWFIISGNFDQGVGGGGNAGKITPCFNAADDNFSSFILKIKSPGQMIVIIILRVIQVGKLQKGGVPQKGGLYKMSPWE